MITVTFADGCLLATASKSLWQYDYGQQLEIVGLDLPEVFQVDFCNSGDTSTITVLGENNVVSIPDQFILDGRGITAFCFVYDETTGGTTRAEMKLPVLPRPERTEEQPDPEQEHVIDQLISELGENVEDAEAWAIGERDGVPVSESDPTYNNNAKYWAGKAMTDAPVTSVNGKAGDIVLDLDDIPNGEQYARTTPAQIQQIGTNAADIADIEELIPAEASAGNQLADKYFVNNEIQTNSAHFRGSWANWFAVPTDKNQYPADNKGVKTPSANDYIVVLDASGYPAGQTILSGTWRFSYAGSWEMNGRNGWKNEYQVNETALHTEQIAAINAKIPSQASASNQLADKNLVNTKLMAYRTAADQDVIDGAQDSRVNALQTTVNGKQNKITVNGILKGNGLGGIFAAVAGMDYLPTSALAAYRSANAQDAIDNAQNQNIDKNTAAINTMQPAATAADIGKALIVKTVADGKPTSYEYGEAGGGGSALTAGDGIDISNDVISNTQGIEYIVGTQTAATSKWTGVSTDETLKVGKIIAYYLPYAGASAAATLALTMADGTTTREISLQLKPNATVTTQFPAGSIIILVYDGSYWRVNASYDTDTNTNPTGYCLTNGSVAAKSATCSFGYRGDTNYFPCLFRYANTAADATLAITTYAPEAAPIYVNGARTSATNTFGAGVILFLYYNGAYYCYNDGRFPILVDGAVTSVQEYAAGLLADYRTAAAQDTIDSGKQAKITANGILKGDGAGGVSSAVAGVDYLQSAPVTSVNGQTGDVTIQPATDAQVATAVDDWLDENVAQETGYIIDASLTMSNAAPPASAVGDLKSALTYNKNKEELWAVGGISSSNGNDTTSTTRLRTTSYIDKDIFKAVVASGYKLMIFAYSSGTYQGVWNGTALQPGGIWLKNTIDLGGVNAQYDLRLTFALTGDGTIAVADSLNVELLGTVDSTLTIAGKAADAKATGLQVGKLDSITARLNNANLSLSGNYFDRDSAEMLAGFVKNTGSVDSSSGYHYAFVALQGAGSYVRLIRYSTFGIHAANVQLFDKNKQFIKSIAGTRIGTTNLISFELSEDDASSAVYTVLNVADQYPDVMGLFFNSENYDFIGTRPPNANFGSLTNPLYKKKLIVDGDSICQGAHDLPYSGEGWFGRLKNDFSMTGDNYAVGGGTITDMTDTTVGGNSRHSVVVSLETIVAENPQLDYLLLEGGTNDADLIGRFSGDTPQSKFGSWTATDYSGNYDTSTFCGAVEMMFYKALNYWPKSKIGFIIPMQMGENNDTSTNRRRYFDEIVSIAKKWHIPVLDLWNESQLDSRLTAYYDSTLTSAQNVSARKCYYDGQHPTSYGYDLMQIKVENWVKGL